MIERKGNPTTIVFEEGVGDIPVALQFEDDKPGMIWMTQPQPQFGRQAIAEERTGIAAMLSLSAEALDPRYPIQMVSSGVPFLYVPVRDLASIKSIKVNSQRTPDARVGHDRSVRLHHGGRNGGLDSAQPHVLAYVRHIGRSRYGRRKWARWARTWCAME